MKKDVVMKLRPIKGRIAVRPLEAREQTKGGIVIPDSAKEKSLEGEVVAMAEDATEEVAVGDHVIYREYAGTEINLDGETIILMEADDLLIKYIATDTIPE
jgi:chaperonin GroES